MAGQMNTLSPNSQWSMLPIDVLGMILSRLDLADHARFSSVCSSWGSAASENPPTNKPLGLVFSDDPEWLVHRFLTSIRPSWDEAKVFGCFEGWLVLLIDGREMLILNAASGAEIPLPPPPRLQGVRGYKGYKAILSSPPSGNCTVVLSQGNDRLWFCRLGVDKSFTPFYPRRRVNYDTIVDVAFWKKEQLCAIDQRGYLTIFDSGLTSVPTKLPSRPSADYTILYLVGLPDKLLAVGWTPKPEIPAIMVFQLHPVDSRWVEAGSLGDSALLLGYSCSLSLSAKDHPEFRGNHVYYGESPSFEGELGSFSLDDKVCDERYLSSSRKPAFFNLFGDHRLQRINYDC